MRHRTIDRQPRRGDVCLALGAEIHDHLAGTAAGERRERLLHDVGERVVGIALRDHLGEFRRHLGDFIDGDGLQVGAEFAFPSDVGDGQSLFEQVVAGKFHLPLEVGDVGTPHPFEETRHHTRTGQAGNGGRERLDVGPLQRLVEQGDVSIDPLADHVHLGIGRTFPRESVRAVLAEVFGLARPDVFPVIAAAAALLEIVV